MKKMVTLILFLTLIVTFGYSQISVTLNLPNPCSTVSVINYDLTQKEFIISLMPNPSHGKFSIKLNSNQTIGNATINAFGLNGRSYYSEQIYCNSSAFIKVIQLNNLPKGVYIISVTGENLKTSKKMIIN